MLRSLAPEIWVAEAPLRWLGVELGRRMTVIRLSSVELFAAPGLESRRRDLSFQGLLGHDVDPRWSEEIDQVVFPGSRFLTEIEFLHRPSGSLILGDLCMNIGPDRPLLSRAFVRLDGAYGRFAMPRTIRLTVRNRRGARLSLERMLEWEFDRVVVGHGDVVESGGRQALAEALGWLR